MLFKEFLIWAFWDQNVGPGWVKHGKKVVFHTSHVSANPVLPKNVKHYESFFFTETNR